MIDPSMTYLEHLRARADAIATLCVHAGEEPGDDGSLDPRRWASYLKLQRELAALNRRHDAARRAYQREWHQKVAVAARTQRAGDRHRKR